MLRPASAYPLAVDDRNEDCADIVTAQSGSKTPFSAAPLSGLRPRARLGHDIMRDLGAASATLVNVTLTGQGLFGSVAGAIGCRQGAGAGRRGETHPDDAAANRVGLGSRLFSEACDTHGGRWELLSTGSRAELRLTVDYERAVPTE